MKMAKRLGKIKQGGKGRVELLRELDLRLADDSQPFKEPR
jgi:hypothetical protein